MSGDRLFCPFAHCTQHRRSDNPQGFANKSVLKQHLKKLHSSQLHLLTDTQLASHDLLLCRQCDSFICNTSDSKSFQKHQESHVVTRTDSNLELVTNNLYQEVSPIHENHWADGLNFLRTHQLSPPLSDKPSLPSSITALKKMSSRLSLIVWSAVSRPPRVRRTPEPGTLRTLTPLLFGSYLLCLNASS